VTSPPSSTNDDRSIVDVVIVGAGPAGLTAAYALAARGERSIVLEADPVVGGIARTVERDGWRFDIGGHRFFTKVKRIDDLWREILEPESWLHRSRLSRIQYRGKFYKYPFEIMNVLRNLGPIEAVACIASFLWARVRPPANQHSFEGWVSARFGRRLYSMFFETYTQKVWGIHPSQIQADWAAQRIKNLTLFQAFVEALPGRANRKKVITTLIDSFDYPKHGPGMLWERCAEKVTANGGVVTLGARVESIELTGDDVGVRVTYVHPDDSTSVCEGRHLISSMPLGDLALAIVPRCPDDVAMAALALRHRDFLTVALVIDEESCFPDNWIYIHSPEVRVGRIQNFGAWSPHLVKPGATCLGLEYFVDIGDDLWSMSDDDLIALAERELSTLGFDVTCRSGYVVRMPKAYPVYNHEYLENVKTIAAWLSADVPQVHPVGRNGMHKYNNQDHSMLTALLTVENICDGCNHDVWSVNVEEDYLEGAPGGAGYATGATGRDAPIHPT
jgi:protoporphyrinogen oxidase